MLNQFFSCSLVHYTPALDLGTTLSQGETVDSPWCYDTNMQASGMRMALGVIGIAAHQVEAYERRSSPQEKGAHTYTY